LVVILLAMVFVMDPAASSLPAQEAGSVVLDPASGPVGTPVSFVGDIDPSLVAGVRARAYFALIRLLSADCELIVGVSDGVVEVDDAGHVTGSFVVGGEGGCFQTDVTRRATPGRYDLVLGCHACSVGTFEITGSSELPNTGRASVPLVFVALGLVSAGSCLIASARLVDHRRR